MIKKILISIGVLFSFFLMFLFGFDYINILAYSDIGNALGSYPVKLDIDNYNTYNLLDLPNRSLDLNGCGARLIYENNTFTFDVNGQVTADCNVIIFNDFDIELSAGTYTFQMFDYVNYNTDRLLLYLGNGGWGTEFYLNNYGSSPLNYYTATFSDSVSLNTLRVWTQNTLGNLNYSFKLMLYKGDYNPDIVYAPPFKFGYNVNYSLALNNSTSNDVNAGIAITDINGNYLKTGNCVIPAGLSTICNNLNDPLYLPFNIDNNGYISFDYSLGLFIGPVGYLSVTPSDSGLNFVPVFNAYYNGSPTDNLYFKDRYTFNNLFLSGFNVSVNSSTLSKIIFPRNQVDSEFSMNTNKIVNFATYKKIETGIYNYINYVDFINSSPSDIYSFVVTAGVSSPSFFVNRIYTISFSNLSLKVNGDSGNVSPLPNNPNTLNKYNECSAWYDIPCQLGNGLTYVIYEAPIISPVLTFIVSFITMFSSLVSFVDLFRSFGIVFGCFIIYMFIELLHKYSK